MKRSLSFALPILLCLFAILSTAHRAETESSAYTDDGRTLAGGW